MAEERQKLAQEGEELRGAFAQDKGKLEREFAAEQRLLAAERVEMQRIIAEERAELQKKRQAMERKVGERLAEIERAAAADRASIEELREKIQKAGEVEMERKRAAALEELDDAEIRLHTGKYATPAFMAPELAPFPELVFRDDDQFKGAEKKAATPKLPAEPWSLTNAVRDLSSPRRAPIRWKRWAVRGGIAATILITAGTAVMIESRSPVNADTLRAPARAPSSPVAAIPAPATAAAPAVTDSSAGGLGVAADSATLAESDSAVVAAAPDSARTVAPIVIDTARARARRDSVRRYLVAAAAARARADSLARRRAESAEPREGAATVRRQPRADPQDLMMLSDSLAGSKSDTAPEPPALPQPNVGP